MADIRIKDLATTATTTASDDFMAVDGTTNGTRKLSAATPAFLTSVTTPSLTSPASTNLTLGTGTSGAAITVLSASNNVGIGTITPAQKLSVNGTMQWAQTADAGYSGYLTNASTNAAYNPAITRNLIGSTNSTYTIAHGDMDAYAGIQFGISGTNTNAGNISFFAASGTFATNESVTPVARMFIANTGDVSISSTTAGSANAGALVVTGGGSFGNNGSASYFGGAVTVGGALSAATFSLASSTGQIATINSTAANGPYVTFLASSVAAGDIGSAANVFGAGTSTDFGVNSRGTTLYLGQGNSVRATISSTGATFAGTVSPQQATTAAAPAYVKGAIYFDTTLNKLRVGGATAYETITSV